MIGDKIAVVLFYLGWLMVPILAILILSGVISQN